MLRDMGICRLALDKKLYNHLKIAVANAGQLAAIPLVNLWVHIMHGSRSQCWTYVPCDYLHVAQQCRLLGSWPHILPRENATPR